MEIRITSGWRAGASPAITLTLADDGNLLANYPGIPGGAPKPFQAVLTDQTVSSATTPLEITVPVQGGFLETFRLNGPGVVHALELVMRGNLVHAGAN